ncbi:MAG: ShlB/FhaC/HecB family hemolysin secretion/activation protein [Betaproteobacteria bacterium]|nr:ShlB/FhaC/HecB family hemolysin secretion/activation protein [Rhodocyclaceae bacterium]MCA3135048.1 ShlB/FhaC/HecB family hemolysin secretion/activation protein [Rhodocyclaceae bacterium]MCA3143149.1 ShlB/FhaC/HecB family hemolysin secretion/activation protein [Rhodocyclaceae bacterium]MCA3146850.1 ShlB/FhaC/HecB family hemolysin secretion/activation protein [Rhodocyclaceae bacterium]
MERLTGNLESVCQPLPGFHGEGWCETCLCERAPGSPDSLGKFPEHQQRGLSREPRIRAWFPRAPVLASRPGWGLALQRRVLRLASLLLAASVCSGGARAQTVSPGAADQEFLRQQERERALREQQQPSADVFLKREEPAPTYRLAPEQPCFVIERIQLAGDDSQRFAWSLGAVDTAGDSSADAARGRCLGARGINELMRRVQNAIVARGFVTTRVLAQPQDLSTGMLTLTVLPGRIRAIRFADPPDMRASHWNAIPAKPGDLLNLRDLEQALENFKRVPTIEADLRIVPAEGNNAKPGESDVVIAWKQRFPLRLSLSADDSGIPTTGRYQGYLTLSYDNWWTSSDLFYVSLNRDLANAAGDGGTNGHIVHYSIPFGYWLLAFSASESRYRQSVVGASQTYLYSGQSRNNDVRLSRIVHRDAMSKTGLALRFWARESANFIDDTEIEVQRRRMAGWEVSTNHRRFLRAVTLDLTLGYRAGTGAMGSIPAPEEAFGEGTSQPRITFSQLQLGVPFALGGQRLRFGSELRAQWNGTPLVPQDRFAIGSRYSVRGFDGERLLLGDRGWLARNELSWALSGLGQDIFIALDHGQVGGPSTTGLTGTSLSGAAIGVRGTFKWVAYEVFAGRPLAKPPGFVTADMVAGFSFNATF